MVGCGNISAYHVDAIAAAKAPRRVAITCLVDPDASRTAALSKLIVEKLGGEPPRIFSSLEEALAADPEGTLFAACDVMVPSWETAELGDLHEYIGSQVLQASRHLMLEKPIAVSSAAGERLIALHQEYCPEKVFMVAENAQYWPEIVETAKLLADGAIGEILGARAKFWESAMGEWAVDYLPGSWRCDESKLPAASFTFDGGTHWIRPLRMWFGEVDSVVGMMGSSVPHMAGPSMSQHVFKFTSGKVAGFESMLAPKAISDQPFFQIQGSEGEIVIDGFGGGARLYTADDSDQVVCKEFCHEGWNAGYEREYVDFVRAALDGKALAAGPDSALRDLKVTEAMVQSDAAASWIAVPGPGKL